MPTTDGNSSQADYRFYNDFMLFAEAVLKAKGDYLFPFADFHREVAEKIIGNRYVAIILARGHLKSTILKCYALWRLFRETNYEICFVSNNLGLSSRNLGYIQDCIEGIPWLNHLKPLDTFESWSQTKMKTSNGNFCYIKPFKPSARGEQPNELLYDDLLRESDIDMDDIKYIFRNIFLPMGQTKRSKHIVVGTPISADDLFAEIEQKAKKSSRWVVYKKPAIVEENGKQVPAWKERFSIEELMELKQDMGNYDFNREYLCNPLAPGSGFFEREMVLNAQDDELGFSYNTKGTVTIGADFAMSESKTGDYNVFTVVDSVNGKMKRKFDFGEGEVELEVENPVVIKKIERYKGATGQVQRLLDLYKTYRASKIILDVSSFGTRFAQELRDKGVNVDAQDFRPANRSQLLVNLRRLFESDDPTVKPPRIVIPYSNKDGTRMVTEELCKELSGFDETKTKGGFKTIASKLAHDDMVFSLSLAVKDVVYTKSVPNKLIWIIGN